ncbi:5' nucleotidase family protein [Teladorsagia circumcincta]|uniref:5' nucleotidase family protein n=1 Tax=Teladorsagia circumcincta TaxID=45464 RepID=A0A2G9UHQ7_TELCI|nr:5' nucleotidase family protein [Teladorsagia circumcincta]
MLPCTTRSVFRRKERPQDGSLDCKLARICLDLHIGFNRAFRNVGMSYMLGEDWRKYFKYIVVLAKKPTFFKGREPFRIYDPDLDMMRFEKVHRLEEGQIYSGGNIDELSARAGFKDKGVLYFGDHIYTDLADPILRLGWRTAAIVPELAREIRVQNGESYQ